jgi:hypothetical protein
METLLNTYQHLFPHTDYRDWFYAFLGLLLHATLKLKNIPFKHFKWKVFLDDFAPAWFFTILTIVICLGTLPQVFMHYSALDSAFIGYSSASIFKQLFKTRMSSLGLKWPHEGK